MAAVELGSYYVSISGSTRELAKNLNKSLDDTVGKATKKIGKQGEGLGSSLASGISKTLKAGAATVGAAVGGTLALSIKKGFDRLNAIEQAEAKLRGVGKSGKEVASIMESAGKAVKGTAFGLGEAAGVAATMSSAGVKGGAEMTRVLKLVGDTAQIAGSDMGEIGAIWGKVAAKGKLDGEVMAQLLERQIGILPALAEHYNVTAEEASKMVSEGKVSFEDFANVMEQTLGGAALKSGETVKGAFANLNAALGRFGEALLKPIYEVAPQAFTNLTAGIDSATEAIKPLAAQFGEWLAPRILDVSKRAGELAEKLPSALSSIKSDPQAQATLENLKNGFVNLVDAAKEVAPALGSIATSGAVTSLSLLSGILNSMAPLINGVLIPALSGMSKLLAENEWMAKALGTALTVGFVGSKVTSGVTGAVSSFGKLSKSVKDSKDKVLNFVDGAKTAGGAAKTMAGSVKAVAKAHPELSKMGVAGKVLSANFPRATAAVKGVGGAFTALRAAMVSHPLLAIGAVVVAVGAALWAFFTKTETGRKIWEACWNGIKAAFTAAWAYLQPAWETMKQTFMDLWNSMQPAAMQALSVVSGVFHAIGAAFQFVWNSILSPAWEAVKFAWSLLVVALYGGWLAIKAVFEGLGTVFQGVWNVLLKPAWDALKLAWSNLVLALTTLWNTVLKPAFIAIGQVFVAMWNGVLLPVWNALKAAWNALLTAMKFLWESVLRPAFVAIGQVFTTVWNSILQPAFNAMRNNWNTILNAMRQIWETVLKPTFHALGEVIKWVVDNVVKPALEGMKVAFGKVKDFVSSVVEGIKTVWNSLRAILAKPINFLIESVWNNGVLRVWDNAKKFLPVTNPPGKVAPLRYATGGAVYGSGTGTSDSIPALLSNGEHVLTAKEVKAFGGHRAVELLRGLVLRGKLGDGTRGDMGGIFSPLQRFAKGGAVLLDRSKVVKEEPAWMAKVDRGHAWAKSRSGRPYVWGGSAHGSSGTDCSGFMSGIADVILGGNGARRWATGGFNTGGGDQVVGGQHWKKGLGPGFSIGVWNGGPYGGHTYGTLGATNKNVATNVESGGSPSLVKYGAGAAGADDPQTAKGSAYHLAIGADGDFISGGGGGMSPAEKRGFIKEKIKEILKRVIQPIKDAITGIVGEPTIVPKEIPHKALDILPNKFVDSLFDVVDELGDNISSIYEKATKLKDIFIPSFLRDSGGYLPTGTSIVQNNTGSPEFVLTMKQWEMTQDVLKRIGREDLVNRLGRYVKGDEDPQKTTAMQLANSAIDFAQDDFFTFIGLGGRDNIFTNPGKSLPGTLLDMMVHPERYQTETAAETQASGGSDDEIAAAAVSEAIEADPMTTQPVTGGNAEPVTGGTDTGSGGGTTTGLRPDADTADYRIGNARVESQIQAPEIDGSDPGGGDAERWRPLMRKMLEHYKHPLSWLDVSMRRLKQESNGNPRAINNWDSNAAAGMPSVGLMQVIRPTYQAHKDPDFDKPPYLHGVSTDGAANIAASMRYTMKQYGSLPAGYGRAGGYKKGGWIKGKGTSTSDSIPAWLSDGEFVVNAASASANKSLLEAINGGYNPASDINGLRASYRNAVADVTGAAVSAGKTGLKIGIQAGGAAASAAGGAAGVALPIQLPNIPIGGADVIGGVSETAGKSVTAVASSGKFVLDALHTAAKPVADYVASSVAPVGELFSSAATPTPPAATNATAGGTAPILNVENLVVRDEESAMMALDRQARRASRSANIHGGR